MSTTRPQQVPQPAWLCLQHLHPQRQSAAHRRHVAPFNATYNQHVRQTIGNGLQISTAAVRYPQPTSAAWTWMCTRLYRGRTLLLGAPACARSSNVPSTCLTSCSTTFLERNSQKYRASRILMMVSSTRSQNRSRTNQHFGITRIYTMMIVGRHEKSAGQ